MFDELRYDATMESLAALLNDVTAAEILVPYVPEGIAPTALMAIGQTFARLLADRDDVRRALFGEPHPDAEAAARRRTIDLLGDLAEARAVLIFCRLLLEKPAALKRDLEDSNLTIDEYSAIVVSFIHKALRPNHGQHAQRLLHAVGPIAEWLSFYVRRGEALGNLDMDRVRTVVMEADALGLMAINPMPSTTYEGFTITAHSSAETDGEQSWRVRWYHPERGTHVTGMIADVTDGDGAIAYAKMQIDALLNGTWGKDQTLYEHDGQTA